MTAIYLLLGIIALFAVIFGLCNYFFNPKIKTRGLTIRAANGDLILKDGEGIPFKSITPQHLSSQTLEMANDVFDKKLAEAMQAGGPLHKGD